MGTTLTAATLVTGGTVLVGHVGDSRAYLLHDGELRQVTVDHSLVEELVREGRLTADEAAVHPQRSIITRALGVDASVEVDVYPVELAPGDRLLLCSDGLTGMVQTETIAATLRREEDPARAAAALVDAANVAGGEDNITVVVVAVTDEAPSRAVPDSVAPIEATVVEEEQPPPEPGERRRRGARGVGRVLLWALPIVVVLGVAVGAVGWYARRSYYVDLHQGRVTVFKGVPGGLAGWDPTIARRTAIARRSAPARRPRRGEGPGEVLVARRRQRLRRPHPRQHHHHDHDAADHDGAGCHHQRPADHADEPGAGGAVKSPTARRRRSRELGLGLLAVVVTAAGYVLLLLADRPDIPADLWVFLLAVLGLYVVAHLAVRRFAPRADPTLLPIAFLLNGIGYITISRLDRDLARVQAIWTAVGIAAFVVTLIVVRNIRTLERYKYTFLLLGIAALLLPLAARRSAARSTAPGCGCALGPINFQPGEAAKVLLVVFFAAYLVDKRELLAAGTRHIGRISLPDPKHLGPLLLAWAFSILVMVREKDLGSSLLFFAVFAAMLYIATERWSYLVVALGMFLAGAFVAYQLFGHVQDRVSSWIDPWSVSQTTGFQLVQSLFALGLRRVRGHRPRPRQPAEDPERVHRLRARRPSARSSGCSARSRCASCSCCSSAVGSASPSRPTARSRSCSPPASPPSSACRRS